MNRFLCAGACVLLLAGSAAARPGAAVSTVNLRAEANTTSEILGKIQGGSRIDVGDCVNGWCAVRWNGKSGFAIMTALDTTGRARRPIRRPLSAYDDDEYVPVGRPYGAYPPGYVVGPGYYGYGPPIVGYGYYGGWRGGYGPGYGFRGGWRRW